MKWLINAIRNVLAESRYHKKIGMVPWKGIECKSCGLETVWFSTDCLFQDSNCQMAKAYCAACGYEEHPYPRTVHG